ncbi:hypothetical protein RB2150_10826 [Rhodobacteraceae bacterium HTCC2150]|nr:hypothetical protein RB2150_10826 [Rhodobacteraceae bacterium HTCC2150]
MMEMRPLFSYVAEVATPQVAPKGPYGTRRFIPITGGTFMGDRVSGKLLGGGADCQLIRPDGVAEMSVRLPFETDDGVMFLMRGLALRHGSAEVMQRIINGEDVPSEEYYFRESMIFEAPKGKYDWLNKILAIATGDRRKDTVHINVFELL